MTRVEPRHYSGINFDWVIVREIRFSDNPAATSFNASLKNLGANIHVTSHIDEAKTTCRTTVRLSVDPPEEQPDEFQSLTGTVEGQFSVVAGATPSVDIEQFAKLQAPAILMPFLRDALASATSKSRFGQVLLPPMNVIALMKEVEAQKQPQQSLTEEPAKH